MNIIYIILLSRKKLKFTIYGLFLFLSFFNLCQEAHAGTLSAQGEWPSVTFNNNMTQAQSIGLTLAHNAENVVKPSPRERKSHVPRDGLVAEYLFENNARDTSGNGHHGAEEGDLEYVPGKINQAAKFDGVDDAIKIHDDKELEFGKGPFTISSWIYLEKKAKMMSILDHMIDSGCKNYVNERSFLFRIWKEKINLLMYETGRLSGQNQFKAKRKIEIKKWHFFSVVYDGFSSVKMYHNSKKIFEKSYSKGLSSTSAPWYIGARYCRQKHPHWFHGKIDNVRIYNRALSIPEIQTLQNEGTGSVYNVAENSADHFSAESGGSRSLLPADDFRSGVRKTLLVGDIIPGATDASELQMAYGAPLAREKALGSRSEIFVDREDGIKSLLARYAMAKPAVKWARVRLVNQLSTEAAYVLFDLRDSQSFTEGHAFEPHRVSGGHTIHFMRDGVHFYVLEDVVMEIWLTLPDIDIMPFRKDVSLTLKAQEDTEVYE